MRCAAITRAGGRCKSVATEGTYCWNHAPEKVEARKQRASRGGKTGGNGRPSGVSETGEAKRWIRALVGQLLQGTVERDVATAAFQGINVLARYIELENKLKLTEEIEQRLEALEALEQPNGHTPKGGYGTWRTQ